MIRMLGAGFPWFTTFGTLEIGKSAEASAGRTPLFIHFERCESWQQTKPRKRRRDWKKRMRRDRKKNKTRPEKKRILFLTTLYTVLVFRAIKHLINIRCH